MKWVNNSSTNNFLNGNENVMLETQLPPVVERSQSWLWLIAISVTFGVILLIILVIVLWCVSIKLCGFFKRHRPQQGSPIIESQNKGRYHVINSLDDRDEGEMMNDDDEAANNLNYPLQSSDSLPIFVPNTHHLIPSSNAVFPQTVMQRTYQFTY
ncbi:unnamed protein product [Didymodactylos carnosus]|uniref:Uncharacterized protein n=1 Tax=Didymodactylos carnosus TaxID=1234261 RepID=A0A813QRS2_9BILA|nr:unnamed protein product [Didymodactylos carnosus]CAF1016122.1 unnamed protein product [Didymodactylos carnosus]CAF3554689.1 unnamed protein product [Didymodactylos carnosus]CAF3785187.1 unnamed protein product [Didymodactylos carnosus]